MSSTPTQRKQKGHAAETNRHLARVVAIQALYELDCTAHSLSEVMQQRMEEIPLTGPLQEIAFKFVNGVLQNRPSLDRVLQRYAPEWPLHQVAIVDRNILRLAVYEMAMLRETPTKSVINEAVDLAAEYGSDNATRFVNGVLGTLAEHEADIRDELEIE